MPDAIHIAAFAVLAVGMAFTPGPNMIYLSSRSVCQGPAAGFVSLAGVALGFVFYMLCAALGISALIATVPLLYDALRFVGAVYLLYLGWQVLKSGGSSPFMVRNLAKDSPQKLFAMGLFTNLLNPKSAVLFLSLLPQFIVPEHGGVLAQSLVFGTLYIAVSACVNGAIILAASSISAFLMRKPFWVQVQRWFMGTVLCGLALRMALEARR